MIEIDIPKDIKEYREKFFFSMTLRQTICFVLGCAIVVPSFLIGVFKYHMNADVLGWIALLVLVPLFGIGFIEIKGMTLEKLILESVKTLFIYPEKRYYKEDNNNWGSINEKE